MNNLENPKIEQPASAFLETEELRKFIENREIKAEDLPLLEALARFPLELIIEFHNFFHLSQNRSRIELSNQLEYLADSQAERREFLNLLLELVTNYDWIVAHNFIRVLERVLGSK